VWLSDKSVRLAVLMYGEVNALLLAQDMGCSISFLEQHYGHVRTADMVDALTRTIRENKGAFEMVAG
jgi:hypothetical protein